MRRLLLIFLPLFLIATLFACNSHKTKKKEVSPFLTAKEVVLLNQVVYKENIKDSFAKYAPNYEIVFLPKAVNGNYAVIAKNKTADQYALIIRGSLIEFSNEGFQNFILQDFNIFTIKPWNYADTVKESYISQGTYVGFQNLLQLKDIITGLSVKDFIETKIPTGSSIVVTGHSPWRQPCLSNGRLFKKGIIGG
jgi:hypothetical protein